MNRAGLGLGVVLGATCVAIVAVLLAARANERRRDAELKAAEAARALPRAAASDDAAEALARLQKECDTLREQRAEALAHAGSAREALNKLLEAQDERKAGEEETRTVWVPCGWCRALPGSVTGTPVPADLDGDGDLEVVVPCMTRGRYGGEAKLLHPQPDIAAQVFAFHHDGKPVKGWPVTLLTRADREAHRRERRGYSEDWASSPSVADLDGDGKDDVVLTITCGGCRVIYGNGVVAQFDARPGGDPWATVPLVDVDRDGVIDLIGGWLLMNARGGPVPGWPADRMLKGGFAPCVGDANGDGELEFYHPFYANASTIGGFDCHGSPLAGWPQKVGRQCLFAPVMGDVDGDGKMEVCAADQGSNLMLWTWDGKPFGSTKPAGQFTAVFKSGIRASGASPTLADLDGDGAAEIIAWDDSTCTLRAWHADGRGVGADDGTLVRLPAAKCEGGVTVGDLGGDGVMDLFVSTWWVQRQRDGVVRVVNMLPDPHWVQPDAQDAVAATNVLADAPPTSTQCTITDLDGDGNADILFGLVDGRLLVYPTRKAYRAEWMEWPTQNANVRHTGCWLPRDKRPPEPPRRRPGTTRGHL